MIIVYLLDLMLLMMMLLLGDVPTDDILVDDFNESSFRRKDREGNLFNPSIFFRYWRNVKAYIIFNYT